MPSAYVSHHVPVSRSLVSRVMKYIGNQKEHHKKMDFATEYALLLKKHGLEPKD